MKKHLVILLALAFGLGCNAPEDMTTVQVRFSPHGGCQEQIVSAINRAQKNVLIQAYSFTNLPIGEALIADKNRGVRVEIILDRSNENSPDSLIHLMMEHGVPIYIDSSHAIAHNKVMVIDNDTVLTGSFNFTKSAEEKNAENCLVIQGKKNNIAYTDNWLRHKEHSRLY